MNCLKKVIIPSVFFCIQDHWTSGSCTAWNCRCFLGLVVLKKAKTGHCFHFPFCLGPGSTICYDPAGKARYLAVCQAYGVVPISYFLRHMKDSELILNHRGLNPKVIGPATSGLAFNSASMNLTAFEHSLFPLSFFSICVALGNIISFTELFVGILKEHYGTDTTPLQEYVGAWLNFTFKTKNVQGVLWRKTSYRHLKTIQLLVAKHKQAIWST